MLNFQNISILDKHIKYLQKIMDTNNFFLVWWSVRDILLWINNNPTDIDFTMKWNPNKIYKSINKENISHFITEKFWTITLIKNNETMRQWSTETIKYELTPLRTESWYEDTRHPDQITRSDDIILDSQRRDFTINCIYYFSVNHKFNLKNENKQKEKINTEWLKYIPELNLFIIQNHEYIHKLFKNWEFQTEFFDNLFLSIQNKQKNNSNNLEITPNILRIIIDPFNWISDLELRTLRTCGKPDKRFQEDALRLIRAIRFVNVLNQKLKNQESKDKIKLFDFEKESRLSIKKNNQLIKKIAKERIKEEIVKVFQNWNPFWFISLLDESELLKIIFPALHKTKNIAQPVRYHPFDVYTHTMLTLHELQKINSNYLVRLWMLYHDVGKPKQFWQYKDWLTKEEIKEIMSWPNNHRRSWPEIAKKDFKNLWFSSKEIDDILRYIANHHKPEELISVEWEKREKKMRKFLSEAWYEKINNILDITMADRLWQYNPLQNSNDITDVNDLKNLLKKLQKKEWQFTIKNLAINWEDIMKHFKITPWPIVWELIKKTLNRVLDDIKNRNKKENIIIFLKKYFKK